MHKGIIYALLAAALFGASTPLAKALLGQLAPVALAALLYLGSGLGLLACYGVRALRRRRQGCAHDSAALRRADWPWLAGAIASGGVAGPVLLMAGLQSTAASSASLLLNLEGVFTALLAWFVFKENFDRRIVSGMALIVVAGMLLAFEPGPLAGLRPGALAVLAACLCWAVDNNLTRKIAASDALQIAGVKGLAAGSVNLVFALAAGVHWPAWPALLQAGLLGFCGYGLSLVLFVLALQHLGSARTGAYFSAAPFFGAILALWTLGEAPGIYFVPAIVLMGTGLWLHLSERHGHAHRHESMTHAHTHVHDAHHQHEHGVDVDPTEPHTHLHEHQVLSHSHPHYPDIHHRHSH